MLIPPLLLFLTLLLTFLPPASSKSCPVRLPVHDSAPRIVGGAFSNYFIQTHIISFYNEGCAGTLLSPEWALTAAHCLVQNSSKAYVAGAAAKSGTPVKIKAVYSHPDFVLPANDIALVQLDQKVPSQCRFIRINDSPDVPHVSEYARVAGFGYTDEGFDPNHDTKLRHVDVPVVDTSVCKHSYKDVDSFLQSGIAPNKHICAGYQKGGCDSCSADSGGPLFVYDHQRDIVQIALVSFGYGCARPAVPGGYTRLSNYISWMRSVGAQFNTTSSRTAVMMASSDKPDSAPATTAPVTTSPPTHSSNDEPTTQSTSQSTSTAPLPQTIPSTPPLIPPTPVSAALEQQPPSSTPFPHSEPMPITPPTNPPSIPNRTPEFLPMLTPAADPSLPPQPPSPIATGPPTPSADGPSTPVSQPVAQPDATAPSSAAPASNEDDGIEMTPSKEPLLSFSSPSGTDLSTTQEAKQSAPNVGAIAGGTVGGVALVAVIVIAVIFARRRSAPAVTTTSPVV